MRDTSKVFFINKQLCAIGLYAGNYIYKDNSNYSLTKPYRSYNFINELQPKLSFSLNFTKIKLREKKWSSAMEARIQLNRLFIDKTRIDIYNSGEGAIDRFRVNLQDFYVGMGNNFYYPLGVKTAIEVGAIGDFNLIGTNSKKIELLDVEKPINGDFRYGTTEDIESLFYRFSYIRCAAKIGLIKLLDLPNTKNQLLFRVNIEQTFFQTPVNLRLLPTYINMNIGFTY